MLRKITKPMIWIIGLVMMAALAACNGVGLDTSGDNVTSEDRISALNYYMVADVLGPDEVVYVQALNQETTWCLGNTMKGACPLDVIDFTHSGLSEGAAAKYRARFVQGYGIVEGWMERVVNNRGQYADTLFIVKPWDGALDERPTELVFEVAPRNIYCVRAPCPTHEVQILNYESSELVHGVDLEASGADEERVLAGYESLKQGGILVAGRFVEAGVGTGIDVGRMYVPMDQSAPDRLLMNDTMVLKSAFLEGSIILTAQTFYTPAAR